MLTIKRLPVLTAAMSFLMVLALHAFHSRTAHAASNVAPHLMIELNRLEQRTAACRLTLLIENKLGGPITDLSFELVLFDREKRVMKLLSVAAGAFPTGKSRINQFDIPDIQCTAMSRILLNTISRCSGASTTPANCLERTRTRSQTAVPLGY